MSSYDNLFQRRLAGENIPDESLALAYLTKMREEEHEAAREVVHNHLAQHAQDEARRNAAMVKESTPQLKELVETYNASRETLEKKVAAANKHMDAYQDALRDVVNGYYRIRDFIREGFPKPERDNDGNFPQDGTFVNDFAMVYIQGEPLPYPPNPLWEPTK